MTITVTVTTQRVTSDKSCHLVNYEYVLRDDINMAKSRAGTGNFAVSDLGSIPGQMRTDLRRRLGYESFQLVLPQSEARTLEKRTILGVAK